MTHSVINPHPPHSSRVRLFFGLTIGLGAGLLFWQELLIGREMLPKFGGVPAVWLVSLAAFQTILLVAYALAHGIRRWSRARILLLLVFFAALAGAQQLFKSPLQAPEAVTPLSVLAAVMGMAGGSLFLLSIISPVMQRLYARLPQRDAHDPYFFYSASNLGSFAGLLLFPLALEPLFGLHVSQQLWMGCAVLFIACLGASVFFAKAMPEIREEAQAAPDRSRWPLWLFYSFLPSALSFGATAHLVNDIAPVPLLSMVPLALYLLTFVLAFGTGGTWQKYAIGIQPFLIAFYLYRLTGSELKLTDALDIIIVLAAFAVTALKYHSMLAASRPHSGDLTFYYLIIALGGALGAVVNVALIPFILPLPLEFVIFLLVSLLPGFSDDVSKILDRASWKLHLVLAALAAGTLVLFIAQDGNDTFHMLALPLLVITLGAMTLRPSLLAVLGAVLVALSVAQLPETLALQRDFFGVKRVVSGTYPDKNLYHILFHGSTFHGGQQLTPRVSTEPLFYYGKGSGIYDAEEIAQPKTIAIIGMGAGSTACLKPSGGHITYFEIDPGMVQLARTWFTFIKDCQPDIVIGDGRLALARRTGRFDMISIDAFSSDAIPVHLLTREAFAVYRQHLTEHGMIVIHISNRFLDLKPLAAGAAAAENMHAATKFFTPEEGSVNLISSEYVALSSNTDALNALINTRGWQPLTEKPLLWTDDKLSLVPLIKIFRKSPNAQTH